MNIGKEYFALIPEAIKQSKKENIHWLKKICEIPGGLSEILYHLSKIDVYSYGLNYSLFFCNFAFILFQTAGFCLTASVAISKSFFNLVEA